MDDQSFEQQIRQAVTAWPDVEVTAHRFGGIEFRVRNREIGHLHGSRQADLPFPVRIREELVASGQAAPHHILPQSGWVSYYLRRQEDVPGAIALFRRNYERLAAIPATGVAAH